jgi:hypothetical protein
MAGCFTLNEEGATLCKFVDKLKSAITMPIQVTCLKCSAKDSVSDEWAGKAIACKKCFAPIVVPVATQSNASAITTSPSAGAQRKRDWGDEEEKRSPIAKQKRNDFPMLLIVGGILALSCILCTGVGLVGYWFVGVNRMVAVQAPAPMVVDEVAVMGGPNEFVKKDAFKAVPAGKGKLIFEQQGRLMPNDAQREGKAHKPFQIRFEQGKTYVIDLRSVEMDAFLRLYDPNGVRIAEDDDGGGGQNARVRIMAIQAGEYVIAATMFGNILPPGGAAFTVTVREE